MDVHATDSQGLEYPTATANLKKSNPSRDGELFSFRIG